MMSLNSVSFGRNECPLSRNFCAIVLILNFGWHTGFILMMKQSEVGNVEGRDFLSDEYFK